MTMSKKTERGEGMMKRSTTEWPPELGLRTGMRPTRLLFYYVDGRRVSKRYAEMNVKGKPSLSIRVDACRLLVGQGRRVQVGCVALNQAEIRVERMR
jgi:hypothetical protein